MKDVLAVGELLVDLIGHEICEDLSESRDFHRYQGGSPANFSANLSRLGFEAVLVATTGKDNLGKYLRQRLRATGLSTEHIRESQSQPTSLILLSRSSGTADFIAYREADKQIIAEQLPAKLVQEFKLFHTTCFALSKDPARTSIMNAATMAFEAGKTLSIDINYAPAIWPDKEEAQKVLQQYLHLTPLVKASKDDISRLFDEQTGTSEAIERLHTWGAKIVCLTKGAEGSVISDYQSRQQFEIKPDFVEVVADATGAGDAFWAGFIASWLNGKVLDDCARSGNRLAAMKLSKLGPLPEKIPYGSLLV